MCESTCSFFYLKHRLSTTLPSPATLWLPTTPVDAPSDVCYCLQHDVIEGNLKEDQRQDATLADANDNFKEDGVA